jgi:hypothetical protein
MLFFLERICEMWRILSGAQLNLGIFRSRSVPPIDPILYALIGGIVLLVGTITIGESRVNLHTTTVKLVAPMVAHRQLRIVSSISLRSLFWG